MIPDSRASQIEQGTMVYPIYATSGTIGDTYVWIQPSISRQPPDPTSSSVIDGIYAQTPRLDVIPIIEREMAWEFEAWEAASDEALLLFEKEHN